MDSSSKQSVCCLFNQIAQKLPQVKLPLRKENVKFPVLCTSALLMVGVNCNQVEISNKDLMSDNFVQHSQLSEPEIFVLGGIAFYKKNNSTVIFGINGKNVKSDFVGWKLPVQPGFLETLLDLLNQKDPTKITKKDILQLFPKWAQNY